MRIVYGAKGTHKTIYVKAMGLNIGVEMRAWQMEQTLRPLSRGAIVCLKLVKINVKHYSWD